MVRDCPGRMQSILITSGKLKSRAEVDRNCRSEKKTRFEIGSGLV